MMVPIHPDTETSSDQGADSHLTSCTYYLPNFNELLFKWWKYVWVCKMFRVNWSSLGHWEQWDNTN